MQFFLPGLLLGRWGGRDLSDLTDDDAIAHMRQVRDQHRIVHATFLGGEPMMRVSLLARAIREFPINSIITNGSYPFPEWREVKFWVSLDGPKALNDEVRKPYDPMGKNRMLPIRQKPSMYERTRNHVLAAPYKQNISIHSVLNRFTWRSVYELVEDWVDTGISGVAFSFITPKPGEQSPWLIPDDERNQVIDLLLEMKRRHGSFLHQTSREIKLFRSGNIAAVVGDNCMLKRGASISFDSQGNRLNPCVMGEMDCDRCGCVVALRMHAVRHGNLAALIDSVRTYC